MDLLTGSLNPVNCVAGDGIVSAVVTLEVPAAVTLRLRVLPGVASCVSKSFWLTLRFNTHVVMLSPGDITSIEAQAGVTGPESCTSLTRAVPVLATLTEHSM
jgi:hypothetical protein